MNTSGGTSIITVNSRKFDGSIRRTWKGEIAESSESLLVLVGVFEDEVVHDDLGVIKAGTVSYEFYWLDRWYNVFRFHEPTGELRNYYCNINVPPVFSDGILDYVDLDIDVLVATDLGYRVLDRDDFEESSIRYGYSDEIRKKAEAALEEVIRLIERREFPFDFTGSDPIAGS